ncbi:hypothetical protein EYZ11_009452 [Aspergillus tanneri]|nr:hypothetical protein EYZ11_009452 [Aspergillus tanneri]
MTLGPPVSPVRQASPQLPVNLASNNPFRNRALSPSSSATSGSRPERPTSTNPFLDDIDALSPQSAPVGTMTFPTEKQDLTDSTRDLFDNLSLNSAPQPTGFRPAPAPLRSNGPPPNGASSSRAPPTSRERREKNPLDIFADPPSSSKPSSSKPRDRERRPRRNSESSVMDRTPKLLDADDEKRRRERRRRERKDGKPRSKKGNYQLDIIDKLDVTSIYGTGMFHHDGPFDACNPSRNRKGLRTAPMQAFPEDSTNMALGGAGPLNQNIDLNLFHGRTEEGYNDFSYTIESRKTEGVSFDPKSRIEPVHGAQSLGLGTSTFLDGAPASRSAMQRRQSENEQQNSQNGGLQRKKSLAQRIRGMNRAPSGRVASPEASYTASSGNSGPIKSNEKNPFSQDYDDAWEKKGARIAEESRDIGRARSSSSPKTSTTLERWHTTERTNSGLEERQNNGGGFINRMKSLRKTRPERRVSND